MIIGNFEICIYQIQVNLFQPFCYRTTTKYYQHYCKQSTKFFPLLLLLSYYYIPYPLEYNHGVVFFNMTFWVRFNSKNPTKRGLFDQKMGVYSRKSPKTGLLKRGEVIFKSGALLERIRQVLDILLYYLPVLRPAIKASLRSDCVPKAIKI